MTEWRRVYQGGHHDVWCDGSQHVKTDGGYVWPDISFDRKYKRSEPYTCDCARWKKPWIAG